MTKANDLASLLDANGDVVSSALDNVPASDLVNDTTPQLGGTLDTNTNDINFGTNVKSNYGTSAQLMMYHDGSNGWIKGNNTGNNSIAIQSGGTGTVMISGSSGQNIISQQGDAAYLHHAGFAKLITTATGVDVTGTAVTDGLTVAGNVSVDSGTIKLDGNYPTGTGNVALGDAALDDASLSGSYNTAIGSAALTANTSANQNTGIGAQALLSATTGGDNTAVGLNALVFTTTGAQNTAIGSQALLSNTTASNNTAVGYQAGYSTTGGANLTFVGGKAGYSTTAGPNDAYGFEALTANTTGINNVAFGFRSLYSNDTASNNTAVGYQALYANTTAAQSTAVGALALDSVTTGNENTAVGYQAGNTITTAAANTMFGRLAGRDTTGSYNTFLGHNSGYQMTTGSANTILGRYNGNQNGLDIRTSSNNIVLSDGDGNAVFRVTPNRVSGSNKRNADGSYMGIFSNATNQQLADESYFTISGGTAGGGILCIYEGGSGASAVYHVGYNACGILSSTGGIWSTTDTDGFSCVIVSGHNMYVKNRRGSSIVYGVCLHTAGFA